MPVNRYSALAVAQSPFVNISSTGRTDPPYQHLPCRSINSYKACRYCISRE